MDGCQFIVIEDLTFCFLRADHSGFRVRPDCLVRGRGPRTRSRKMLVVGKGGLPPLFCFLICNRPSDHKHSLLTKNRMVR